VYILKRRKRLYSNSKFSLGEAKTLGTLGKTPISKSRFWILKNVSNIDDKYKSREISIIKEKDRLVFKGRFKKSQDVKVILYRNGIANYYDVPISKKPYTALCVDILTEEETKNGLSITKYINSDLLYGKYSIFVEIDGVLYKTDKFVKF